MEKSKKIQIIIILSAVFLTVLYFSIFANYNDFGFYLFKKSFSLTNETDSVLLEVLRFPRVIKAMIAGSSLALSGMLLQSASKNPLAEPFITGISSGASLGIVLSVLLFGGAFYSLFGFLGAIIASVLVIFISGIGKFSITKLILIGLSINMFVSAIISFIMISNPDKTYVLSYLLTGNISDSVGFSDKTLLILFVLLLVISSFLMPKINFLRLDKSILPNLKRKIFIYNLLVIGFSAVFAGLSVLTAGILSFAGVVIPQISRILVGTDYRYLFFVNSLLGSSFILFSDLISRIIIYPMQLPLGIVVAFISAPIFVYFLVKKGGLLNDLR